VSGKAVVAGVAAAVAGVAAAGAAVAASKSDQGDEQPRQVAPPQEQVAPPQEVTVVDQPPAGTIRDDVLLEESPPEGYAAPTSTEGVEKGVRDDGDDPMIGGGSR
jgi:hypothetical protein